MPKGYHAVSFVNKTDLLQDLLLAAYMLIVLIHDNVY